MQMTKLEYMQNEHASTNRCECMTMYLSQVFMETSYSCSARHRITGCWLSCYYSWSQHGPYVV